MQRLRLYDMRLSRLPDAIGLCSSDVPGLARYVNSAQNRLLLCREAGEEGWWGGWAEMAFTVTQNNPFITAPRQVARIAAVNIYNKPIQINNQWYEYLRFGNGRMPKTFCNCPGVTEVFSRNNAVTMVDLAPAPQFIQIVITDPADQGRRILIQGSDSNNVPVYSQDGFSEVSGVFVNMASPSSMATYPAGTSPIPWNSISGIQKDITAGYVQIFQVDPNTGASSLLLTMEPTEQTASYRRYYLSQLFLNGCCTLATPTTPITVLALAKLELIPVFTDTDYLLFQNQEAIIEECCAVRYSEMDTTTSKQMEAIKHKSAIGYLNGELNHYLGKDSPAVNFAPFGTARLNHRNRIGSLI